MAQIDMLPKAPKGRVPAVRPAYRLLERAHASVTGLFEAVTVLDDIRRSGNSSTRGRMSQVEVDVLRSALVFTSAGFDASMKRLVNDVGRVLIAKVGSSAERYYREYLKSELAKPNIPESFRDAVVSSDATGSLIEHFLAVKTKASFQGSGDLKSRVRETLGIPKAAVPNARLESLDSFFEARNLIAHEMDLKDLSKSDARNHRGADEIAAMCSQAFDVASELIHAAASTMRR